MKPNIKASGQQQNTNVEVHLQPGARANEIVGLDGNILRVRVTAPPREGRANEALLALMAQELNRPKSDLSIIRGHSSRHKVISISGLSPEELKERISRIVSGG